MLVTKRRRSAERGQSLVEVLIAVAVGTIMIAAAVAALVPALFINTQVNELQLASALGKELLDTVRVLSEADWNALYLLSAKGPGAHYFTTSTQAEGLFAIRSGDETLQVGTSTFIRYFFVENVCRNTADDPGIAGEQFDPGTGIPVCPGASVEDASTQKITVSYRASGRPARTLSAYLVRYQNRTLAQSDWFGGPGEEGPRATSTTKFSTSENILYASSTGSLYLGPGGGDPQEGPPAGSNISALPNEHWAWNDLVGWTQWRDHPDAALETLRIRVLDQKVERFASSSDGEFALDCKTSPNGDICPPPPDPPWWVTNDGSGYLGGWAWNDTYGWVSFSCTNHGGCAQSNYRVRIDSDGFFHEYAWNDVVGWISFNCTDYDYCGTSDYKVRTDWRPIAASGTLESATFDTGVARGARFNSFLWYGERPGVGGDASSVGFQIAASGCPNGATDPGPNGEVTPPFCATNPGTWNFLGEAGDATTYYGETVGPGTSVRLRYDVPQGRYFRYRIRLQSTKSEPRQTPRVDEVIVNWSP